VAKSSRVCHACECGSPYSASIHEFVKRANEYGSITRQEVVSMIPAFFLNIKPSHICLDMVGACTSVCCVTTKSFCYQM
jgi:16S rRNA C967 or C1407 C5-methylase (RsmB/RsmF family)